MIWRRTATSEASQSNARVGEWSLEELMRSGDLLGCGPIGVLERRLAEHYGRAHALCLSSATASLHALAVALDLVGHEVVTSSYAWGGGVGAMLAADADIVFADIDPVSLALAAERAAEAVGPRTKALLSVDLFGIPADDGALRAVAEERGLHLIHDGAQSFGATRGGQPPGAHAHATVLSFGAGKALGAGEGGALLTDDASLYQRLVELTQHPLRQKRELGLRASSELALHARMHPAAAAWAVTDFDAALERVRARQKRAQQVLEAVAASGLCEPQPFDFLGIVPSFHRISAAWVSRPAPRALEVYLRRAGAGQWSVVPPPVSLIPHDRRFAEANGGRLYGRLPIATEQSRKRFVLEETAS